RGISARSSKKSAERDRFHVAFQSDKKSIGRPAEPRPHRPHHGEIARLGVPRYEHAIAAHRDARQLFRIAAAEDDRAANSRISRLQPRTEQVPFSVRPEPLLHVREIVRPRRTRDPDFAIHTERNRVTLIRLTPAYKRRVDNVAIRIDLGHEG